MIFAKNLNFFNFFINFCNFFPTLVPTFYRPIKYFQKLILSQNKVPYVCQFLRKFQLEIIFFCSHTNQKCQSKILKDYPPPCSRGIPTVYFNRRVNCQPSFPASAIVAEPRVFLLLFIIFLRENTPNFHKKSLEFYQKS